MMNELKCFICKKKFDIEKNSYSGMFGYEKYLCPHCNTEYSFTWYEGGIGVRTSKGNFYTTNEGKSWKRIPGEW